MNAPVRPILSPSITYGHLLTTITVVISIGGVVWYQSAAQAQILQRVSALEELRPAVATSTRVDDTQDERIGNLADSLREQRVVASQLLLKLNEIAVSTAALPPAIQALQKQVDKLDRSN